MAAESGEGFGKSAELSPVIIVESVKLGTQRDTILLFLLYMQKRHRVLKPCNILVH